MEETVGETTGIRIEGHEDRDVAVEEGPGDRRVEGMAVDREAVMEDPEGHAVTADLEEVVADDSDPRWAADMEAEDGEEDLGEVTMDHLAHAVAADEAEDTDINLSVMASMEDVPGGIGGVVAMERGIAAIGGHLKSAKKKENLKKAKRDLIPPDFTQIRMAISFDGPFQVRASRGMGF